jgi:hypothetical protein
VPGIFGSRSNALGIRTPARTLECEEAPSADSASSLKNAFRGAAATDQIQLSEHIQLITAQENGVEINRILFSC